MFDLFSRIMLVFDLLYSFNSILMHSFFLKLNLEFSGKHLAYLDILNWCVQVNELVNLQDTELRNERK